MKRIYLLFLSSVLLLGCPTTKPHPPEPVEEKAQEVEQAKPEEKSVLEEMEVAKEEATVNPEDAINALNRGKELYSQDKFDEAIQEFNNAIAINSELEDAYFYRGLAS
jgi:tetratricopeptide (TPR) repeat protein